LLQAEVYVNYYFKQMVQTSSAVTGSI